jgi:hypothetical protein
MRCSSSARPPRVCGSAADYVLYTLASGTSNVFARLGLPFLALLALLTVSKPEAILIAAALLYRAVTYLPCIPNGAAACLAWRHAPALIGAGQRAPAQPACQHAPEQTRRETPLLP